MASCMQQLYMMPQARAAILNSRVSHLKKFHLEYFSRRFLARDQLRTSRIEILKRVASIHQSEILFFFCEFHLACKQT